MYDIDYRIITEYIELNQLLKVCGLAESGGGGSALVVQGLVSVNGQVESRKRCKIRPGQVVRIRDIVIKVLASDPAEVAAHAEARVAQAREKAAQKREKAATTGRAPAPWIAKPKTHKKAKPKTKTPHPKAPDSKAPFSKTPKPKTPRGKPTGGKSGNPSPTGGVSRGKPRTPR